MVCMIVCVFEGFNVDVFEDDEYYCVYGVNRKKQRIMKNVKENQRNLLHSTKFGTIYNIAIILQFNFRYCVNSVIYT